MKRIQVRYQTTLEITNPVRPQGPGYGKNMSAGVRVWCSALLLFWLCGVGGTCDLCSLMNQTTTLSNCSATCGGGQQHYFQYVCCQNLTKLDCERRCNITLTLTKSIQRSLSCGKECHRGGTYNETTEGCDCPEGTTGRCCDLEPEVSTINHITELGSPTTRSSTPVATEKRESNHHTESLSQWKSQSTSTEISPQGKLQSTSTSTSKGNLYVSVGIPLALITVIALVIALIYVWCMTRKRTRRVDAVENVRDIGEM